LQNELVALQVRAVASAAPYWRQRFAELGQQAGKIRSVEGLASVPAVGERDVSPTGDPAEMAGLVLHGGERQFALHSGGPQLRRALRKRMVRSADYQAVVDNETRPTTYTWTGLGFRFPLASTRGDLDAVARAGARLWRVLGLTAEDALVSAVPVAATTEHVALQYAALAAGAPALFPGSNTEAVASTARLAPPTVLAVTPPRAPELLRTLSETGALTRLTTLLLVGAPTPDERAAAAAALRDVNSPAVVLAAHAPSGSRVLWAECRESNGHNGLHTYPDLDVVQLVDPETGELAASGGGELVLTQIGMRGSALLRWRTGDLVQNVDLAPCPACHRQVPRVLGLTRHALVVPLDEQKALDLRAVTSALSGRPEITDWRVVIGPRGRDGLPQVVVHLSAGDDPGPAAVRVAAEIRAVAGTLPTQLIGTEAAELAELPGARLTPRVLIRG
jgi:phenylacetate-coenzyme A ligase PaaK-like adenylate-forming protein